MRRTVLLAMIFAHGEVFGRVTIPQVGEQDHYVTKRDIPEIITVAGNDPLAMRTTVLIYTGEDPTLQCSGTILSEDIIITAATCFDAGVDNVDDFTIVAGDLQAYLAAQPSTAEKIGVKRVSIHPHYEHVPGERLLWDLAIVHLRTKINLETNLDIEAAMLPPPGIIHTEKSVHFGGLDTAPDGSIVFLEKKVIISPETTCFDELEEGTFSPNKLSCEMKEENSTFNQKARYGAIYWGWEKPLVLGSFGSTLCKTHTAFEPIAKFIPWIIRETRLRPVYEVYDDDTLFEEFHEDASLYCWRMILNGTYVRLRHYGNQSTGKGGTGTFGAGFGQPQSGANSQLSGFSSQPSSSQEDKLTGSSSGGFNQGSVNLDVSGNSVGGWERQPDGSYARKQSSRASWSSSSGGSQGQRSRFEEEQTTSQSVSSGSSTNSDPASDGNSIGVWEIQPDGSYARTQVGVVVTNGGKWVWSVVSKEWEWEAAPTVG